MVDMSAVGTGGGRLRGRLCKHLAERYFRRRIVRYRHPLGSQAIGLGNPPPGGVIYAVVYGTASATQAAWAAAGVGGGGCT